jgi:hypothetical protein
MAPPMETIDLHMELEVTSMIYSAPGSRSLPPYLIFFVVLDRETKWAMNGGRFPLLFDLPYTETIFSTDKVWRGTIGVKIDTKPPWKPELYLELLQFLTSCFEGDGEVIEMP